MAMMAADPIFVDTNILVYSKLATSPLFGVARAKLDDLAAVGHPFWISRQILREFLACLSRSSTSAAAVPMPALLADVQSFQTQFLLAEDGPLVTAQLLNLLSTIPCAGKQVHDANIVATMLAHGIPKLLTHNVTDFKRFSGHIAILPLVP